MGTVVLYNTLSHGGGGIFIFDEIDFIKQALLDKHFC